MLGAVRSHQKHDAARDIQSQFYDDVEIDGYFILIPDLESYERILSALGMV